LSRCRYAAQIDGRVVKGIDEVLTFHINKQLVGSKGIGPLQRLRDLSLAKGPF